MHLCSMKNMYNVHSLRFIFLIQDHKIIFFLWSFDLISADQKNDLIREFDLSDFHDPVNLILAIFMILWFLLWFFLILWANSHDPMILNRRNKWNPCRSDYLSRLSSFIVGSNLLTKVSFRLSTQPFMIFTR